MDKVKKPPRAFADIFKKYKNYNPAEVGFGSVRDWGRAFDEVMGEREAADTLGSDDPLSMFGFRVLPTMDELKKAYRLLVRQYHPDNGAKADANMAVKIIAAYSLLKARIERAR